MTRTYINPEGLAAPKLGDVLRKGTLLTVAQPSDTVKLGAAYEVSADTRYEYSGTLISARCLADGRERRIYIRRFVFADVEAASDMDEPL